jgi:hypothetical protein
MSVIDNVTTISTRESGPHLAGVVDEVVRASGHRVAEDATAVLLALGSSPYPLTRRDLSDRLGLALSTLSKPMVFLESHGFIVSTRRFGVALGARFLGHPDLSRNLRDSALALAQPHLEYFVHRHDGLSAVALSTEDSAVIAATHGTAPAGFDARAFQAVLSGILHSPRRDGTPAALSLRGVWAGAAGEDTIAIGSRVRFTGSSAVLGIAVRTPTVAQFSELSLSVLTEANVLTSALRRVYPTRSRSLARPA